MPTDFKLPELGENVTAGDVVRVLVAAGDTIQKDQAVLELETDKATIEVPSSVAGTVKDVRVKQGERINVGQVVLTVDDGAGAKEASKEPEAKAAARQRRRHGSEGEAAARECSRRGRPERGRAPAGGSGRRNRRERRPPRRRGTRHRARRSAGGATGGHEESRPRR